MPRVSQSHLDARRSQILAAARRCFALFGYEGTTVRRLETAAQLSRGAIFHHFGDKESLFLAVVRDDARQMAEVVGEQGLVQVMRDVVTGTGMPGPAEWLSTRLEVSHRLRTDPAFRAHWAEQSLELRTAARSRLECQRQCGMVRTDLPLEVLAGYLELVLEGVLTHLATGRPADELTPVLDLVEATVRRRAPQPGPQGYTSAN
ncbi:MAG TPA: helix-turn-helix domain-containing protein [Pseudonocardiaceae bacterium]|nr:helix-turn-helix domain-containing protein [Pseudonocardiaceae bacterium]